MVHVITGKLEALAIGGVGIFFIVQPVAAPLSLFFLRWSPTMLPYHVFGGSEDKLISLEEEGWILYWIVLIIDTTILSAATTACVSLLSVVLDALLLVWVVLIAMRLSLIHFTVLGFEYP